MIIDLKKFLLEESDKTVKYDLMLSDIHLNGVNPFRTPVHVSARFQNANNNVELMLSLDYILDVPCDRCFEQTEVKESIIQRHVFVHELQDDKDVNLYILVPGDQLNLDELVYADIMLNLPAKLLCGEDCKGLCPVCGQNLNYGSCQCASERIDPRLEALKQLLD